MRLRSALFTLILLGSAPMALAAEHGSGDKKEQKSPEHKITQSESWVTIDPPFSMAIVADNRATGVLLVWVGLDVPDAGMRENVLRSMPILRDAYLRNLMAYTSTHVRLDTPPDSIVISDRLQAITDRALKKKGARILLRQIALRAK
jgi:flagellar basal body-associated protein FliL